MLPFDLNPDLAIYVQIAAHVRMQIALQKLSPGEKLPTIRKLARELKVDAGTVARAYHDLEEEGILASRQGSGTYVATHAEGGRLARKRNSQLAEIMERAILEALGLGFKTEDIEPAFTAQLSYWIGRRSQKPAPKRTLGPISEKEIRFVGSHDLAVELLANYVGTLFPNVRFTTSFVGSLSGLMALQRREADLTGSHLKDEETGEFNIPFVKKILPNETVVLLHLVQRMQGLMVAKDNPKHIMGVEDLSRPSITFVNRQKGSGTRVLLDSRLKQLGMTPTNIAGYGREETNHMAVASLIAQGGADVGLGAQWAASIAGIDFIPLFNERYDLIGLEKDFSRPLMYKLEEIVSSEDFRSMLRKIPGYDVSETGTIVTVS
jgi:molybdate-binding protein/DNA-binding transcriptional regulator YhcF (GntR family)